MGETPLGIRKKNGSIHGWFTMENPKMDRNGCFIVYFMETLNMDDLGVPTCVKTPIYGHVIMSICVKYIVGKSEIGCWDTHIINDIL